MKQLSEKRRHGSDHIAAPTVRYSSLALSLLGLTVCLQAAAQAKDSDGFYAEGNIGITYGDRSRARSRGFHFDVSVKDDRWLIRAQPHSAMTNTTAEWVKFFEAGSDGANIYHLAVFNEDYDLVAEKQRMLTQRKDKKGQPPKTVERLVNRQLEATEETVKELRLKSLTNIANQADGTVYPWKIPRLRQSDLMAVIWLALASGDCWKRLDKRMVPYITESEFKFDSRRRKLYSAGNWQLNPQPPNLPAYISVTNSGFVLFSKTGTATSKGDGKLQAEYKVLQFKQFDGLTLPTAFELITYPVADREAGGPRMAGFKVTGEITNASSKASTGDFIPWLPCKTAIRDHRFDGEKNEPRVTANVPSGRWPTMSEVQSKHDK